MRARDSSVWVAVAFAFTSHMIVFHEAVLSLPTLGLPEEWRGQLYVLLGISFATALVQFLFRERRLLLASLFLLRIIAFTVAALSLTRSPSSRTALLSSLVFEAMIYLPAPQGIVVSALSIALSLAAAGAVSGDAIRLLSPENLLLSLLFPLLFLALGAILTRLQKLASERERLVEQLRNAGANLVETNISLQDHIIKSEEQARNLERERISRELHDTVGYTLMNIIAILKASVELAHIDIERMGTFLEQGIGQAQKGLTETRAALRALRSADNGRPSIVKTITRLAAAFKDTHIHVSVHFSNVPWYFGADIDPVIYRIVQEGITNAIRHGNATEIAVHLSLDAGRIMVTINDNGSGAEQIEEGIGLAGIRERLSSLHGEVSAGNIKGGFRLCASIPVPEGA